jgi:hypothetical protein
MARYSHFMRWKEEFSSLPTSLEDILTMIDWFNDVSETPIRCSDLIHIKQLGSPATIHKNYKLLIEMGFLERVTEEDKRIKSIYLTDMGLEYLARLDNLMKQCINSKRIAK